MSNMTKRLIKLLFGYDWEVIEIQGAVFKITWGIWLLLPFDTFRAIEGYYAVGLENAWGWGLLILGLIHFGAILSNKITLRRWITFIALMFWIFTVVLIYQQSHTAALLPMFVVIALFMGINFLRLGLQQKIQTLVNERKIDLGSPSGKPERRKK